MYSKRSNLTIGFHGCDREVAKLIVSGDKKMLPSSNNYDWLGHGFYFWENNLTRAYQFANEQMERFEKTLIKSKVEFPAVIGSVIDLGNCLDLLDADNLQIVKRSYEILKSLVDSENPELPVNRQISGDLMIRHLDCAVIQNIHALNKAQGLQPYDSVRGVFFEGADLYLNAGFKEKNHIQICICNPNCIKGFFNPIEINSEYSRP